MPTKKQIALSLLQRSKGASIAEMRDAMGCQPAELNAHKLMTNTRAPIDWDEQRAGLGFI